MSESTIGDVTVARGGSVKWGLLFSTIFGSAAYAYFEGVIRLWHTVASGVMGAIEAVGEWFVTVINLEFVTASVAVNSSWWSFREAAGSFGLASWFVSVAAVTLVLLFLFVLLKSGVSRLV